MGENKKRGVLHITPELIVEICKSGVIYCGKSKYVVKEGLPDDVEVESVEVIDYSQDDDKLHIEGDKIIRIVVKSDKFKGEEGSTTDIVPRFEDMG